MQSVMDHCITQYQAVYDTVINEVSGLDLLLALYVLMACHSWLCSMQPWSTNLGRLKQLHVSHAKGLVCDGYIGSYMLCAIAHGAPTAPLRLCPDCKSADQVLNTTQAGR
jgi:hypothetical protein